MSEPLRIELDESAYRLAVSRFVTGVTVVTTAHEGLEHAMTANAVCSVSLDPLLMLLSVEQDARFHDAVLAAGVWGISVLAHDQRAAAAWLATPGRPLHGQLDRVPHRTGPATGVPLLEGSLSCFELETSAVHPAGDHSLVIGHVRSIWMNDHPGEALVYYRGRYGVQA